MLLVCAAVAAIVSRTGEMQRHKAFNDEQVRRWAAAIREANDAFSAMVDNFGEADRIETDTILADDDITDDLANLGLRVEDFSRIVEMPMPLSTGGDRRCSTPVPMRRPSSRWSRR